MDESSAFTFPEPKPLWRRLVPAFGILIFAGALWTLKRELITFKFEDFREYFSFLSPMTIAIAIAGSIAGYLSLVGYDWYAIRYVGQKLSLLKVALTSFIGYAFSMNIGHSTASGGGVRMRLYTGWGFGADDAAGILGFNLTITMVGQFLVSGIYFTFYDIRIPETLPGPIHSVRWLGVLLLCIVAAFFTMVFLKKEAVQLRNWRVEIPRPGLAIPAVLISALDWILYGVVLYQLIPLNIGVDLFQLIGIFLLAQFVAVLSQIPGGLGVFEAAVIYLIPASVPVTGVFSALIAFRIIYYLVPFLLAICLIGGYEASSRSGAATATKKIGKWLSPFIPFLTSAIIFVAGSLLLISSATPTIASRIPHLQKWIPLPVVELAHFSGSVVGVLLILLSEGLRRRVDAAYFGTAVLLVVGIVTSLLKGLGYEEAAILTVILLLLYSSRRRFCRSASLFALRFRPGWWFAVSLVIATTAWIGFAAYQRVNYHPDLWVHFGFREDASRFLRASGGIASIFAALGIWHLLRPGLRTPPPVATDDEFERVKSIVSASPDTSASMALLGDKRFLFSPSGRSFLMFGIKGRTWIALGNPVGDDEENEDLIWEFRELCMSAGARPAFYQVRAKDAHLYAGCGMMLYKLGEEARVNLRTFSLEGPARRNLRGTKSRTERAGASLEVINSDRYDEVYPELKKISDEWLNEKNAGEKGFSLGSFDDEYLRNFDFAVIRVEGTIVAFANVSRGAGKYEMSIDLMRQSNEAPPSTMEYLFIEIMLRASAEGYQWFSLGMAPLAGLENRSLAPLWNRIGSQIFTLGGQFYNFQGLRSYKEKFDPEWEPRYLACRNMLQLPTILIDISSLIGGGLRKVISRKVNRTRK